MLHAHAWVDIRVPAICFVPMPGWTSVFRCGCGLPDKGGLPIINDISLVQFYRICENSFFPS
jgi:hypothetical protein